MVTPLGGAVEWLAVAPAEALVPPVGLHPGVDEWLDVADRERQVGVIPEVPILIGLVVDGAASDLDWVLDVRVIDFMNHPAGTAVSSPLTGLVLRYQLPVFFRWLAGRDKAWDAVTTQDFVANKAHRTRVDRVAGTTWDKDHWVLSRFYGWARDEGLVE